MATTATFFTIYPPVEEDANSWARRYWDTYGFDYDPWKSTDRTILAWPLESERALERALEDDGIGYEIFEADVDCMFGEQ